MDFEKLSKWVYDPHCVIAMRSVDFNLVQYLLQTDFQ
jgi:hypothetical protein